MVCSECGGTGRWRSPGCGGIQLEGPCPRCKGAKRVTIVDNQPATVPGQLLRAHLECLDPLRDHDVNLLRAKAAQLKQTDGEGWAIGEMVERACLVIGAYVDPRD